MSKAILFFVNCAILFTVTGCYRAPCDDDYCTIPATNNPCLTRQGQRFEPGVSY